MYTAVIYEGPAGTRVETAATRIIGVAREDLARVAREQIESGADRIELCGGVGVRDYVAVRSAVGPDVTVGLNRYEFDSLEAIAAYKVAFSDGQPTTEMFLYLAPGADPARDRVVYGTTTFVAVPDALTAGVVAAELRGQGTALVELYAGLGADAAAAVVEATDATVPVGFVSHDR